MTESLDPQLFGDPPARDARFVVKTRWSEMANLDLESREVTTEFLHRQMNEELNGLEISSRNLADFPETDWELRLAIARQCWDEARHVQMFRDCCERRGGKVGDYPVLNFQYRIITKIDSLIGRLAVQNRSFEAAGIDAIQDGLRNQSLDADLTSLLDAQMADEVQHVRYANTWIKKLLERGGARATLALAKAVAQASEALQIVAGGATVRYPVAESARLEAGFSEAEIEAIRDANPRL